MARYYLQPWDRNTWAASRSMSDEHKRHTAGEKLKKIQSGDVIYPVTVRGGSLYLGGRLEIERRVSRSEANRFVGGGAPETSYHFIATARSVALWNPDRRVPVEITTSLQMLRADGIRGLVFRAPGLLDQQTLRGLSELTPDSAKVLDEFLEVASSEHQSSERESRAPRAYSIEDDFEAAEGRPWFGEHLRHERSSALVRRKKEMALARGELYCEVCGFEYESYFGPIGRGFIEVHHAVPLSSLKGETQTRLSDLVLVCSCCHRMLHRGEDLLSPEELAERIDSATRTKG